MTLSYSWAVMPFLQVFSIHAYNTTEFKPAVSVEEAERRYKHWQKAVHRSLDLADLAE